MSTALARDVSYYFNEEINTAASDEALANGIINRVLAKYKTGQWTCVVGRSFSAAYETASDSYVEIFIDPFYIIVWKYEDLPRGN